MYASYGGDDDDKQPNYNNHDNKKQDYNNRYNYNYDDDYGSDDDSNTGPILRPIACYTCHYSRMDGVEQGMPNCNEPFIKEGIPVIICDGYCAKTKTILGDGEYMLTRSCMPNCRSITDAMSSVRCCYGPKCNGKMYNAADSLRIGQWWMVLLVGMLVGNV